jgi:hypothetical protein
MGRRSRSGSSPRQLRMGDVSELRRLVENHLPGALPHGQLLDQLRERHDEDIAALLTEDGSFSEVSAIIIAGTMSLTDEYREGVTAKQARPPMEGSGGSGTTKPTTASDTYITYHVAMSKLLRENPAYLLSTTMADEIARLAQQARPESGFPPEERTLAEVLLLRYVSALLPSTEGGRERNRTRWNPYGGEAPPPPFPGSPEVRVEVVEKEGRKMQRVLLAPPDPDGAVAARDEAKRAGRRIWHVVEKLGVGAVPSPWPTDLVEAVEDAGLTHDDLDQLNDFYEEEQVIEIICRRRHHRSLSRINDIITDLRKKVAGTTDDQTS